MGVLSEFKAFAVKGNVVDMAVGIIIGAAFGKIVSSFVGDVVMPPLGLLIGGVDFSDLAITLKAAEGNTPAVVLAYGKFIQTTVDFIIVAFAIFMGVKAINRLKREEAVAPSAPPVPTKEEQLLSEIRDLLKKSGYESATRRFEVVAGKKVDVDLTLKQLEQLCRSDTRFIDQLHGLVRARLGTGQPTLEDVASELKLPSRTLQRRLEGIDPCSLVEHVDRGQPQEEAHDQSRDRAKLPSEAREREPRHEHEGGRHAQQEAHHHQPAEQEPALGA